MKRLIPWLLLPLLALPLATARAQQQERERGQREHERHGEETELSRHMESIEHAAKRLRRGLRDETQREDAFAALAEIQSHTLACKALVPAQAAKVPEAERAEFVKAYHKTVITFLTRQLELETALLDGDADAIKTAFDAFREMEDSSHERFAPEDD